MRSRPRSPQLLVLSWILSVVLGLTACVKTVEPTEVVVEIDADDSVRELMDAVRVEIWSAGPDLTCTAEDCWRQRLGQDFPTDGQALPIRFPVLPLEGDDRRVFEVIVSALDPLGNVLLEQRAVSSFVPGGSARVRLSLQHVCVDVAGDCGPNQDCHGPLCSTCREGECQPTGLFTPGDDGQLVYGELDASTQPDASEPEHEAGMDVETPPVEDAGNDGEVDAGADSGADAGVDSGEPAQVCEGDTWDHDGSGLTACVARSRCAAGQYVLQNGDSQHDRSCAGCASATFSLGENAASCADWMTCTPGNYVANTPSAIEDRMCAPCATGLTTTQPNLSSCLPPGACPAGKKQVAPGTASTDPVCADCSQGEYCAGGEAAPVSCTGSTWDHDANASTACSAKRTCAAGQFVSSGGNATTDRVCTACASGSFSTMVNAGSCSAWTACASGFSERTPGSSTADRVCAPTPWTRQFASANDSTTSLALDSGGNVIVVGRSLNNAIVRKFDSLGTEQWSRSFLAAANAGLAGAAAVATDGTSIYVVGTTANTINSQPSTSDWDAYVVKYDAAGAVVWTRVFSGAFNNTNPPFATGRGVTTDSAGNVYVVGDTIAIMSGATQVGGVDAFVRKFDSAGTVQWTRQFGTTSGDSANGVAVDGSGNIYVVGSTSGVFSGQPSGGVQDAFVQKFNNIGSPQWTRQFGQGGNDVGFAVKTDAGGNVFVVGHADGMFAGQTSAGGVDAYVRKYNGTGTELWTRQLGGTANDLGLAAAVGANGSIYLSGMASSALSGQTSAGGNDAFVRGYDASGGVLYTRQFGTSAADSAAGLAIDGAGVLYLGGFTAGTLAGSTGTGNAYALRFFP